MSFEREQSESTVLAAIFSNPANFTQFDLTPNHFRTEEYRKVFIAIAHHLEHGFPVEPAAISDTLDNRHGAVGLGLLVDELVKVPTYNADLYAEGLRHASDAELARGIARELIAEGDIDGAIQRLHALRQGKAQGAEDASMLRRRFIAGLESNEPMAGISTGFRRLDDVLGGLHNGDLIVLAARPAMGKTALMLNIAVNSGDPVLIFSGEQPALQCESRIMASEARVPLEHMRNRQFSEDEIQRLLKASQSLHRNYWIYDKSAPSLTDIFRLARQQQHQHGIKAIFVDYIQRMRRDPKKPKHEGVGDNVLGLKELARELDVPVVALAQVNRGVESRDLENRQPHMGDIRDSGEIEQEADVVLTLHRQRVVDPQCEDFTGSLYVAKNRHGPTGYVELDYLERFVRFQDKPVGATHL